MKKLYFILLASLVMMVGCAEINERLDNLEGRVDNIENTQIATISQQIISINNSILLLNTTDNVLKDYITTLETEAENLQTQLTATNTKIDEVKQEILSTISSEKAALLAELEAFKATVNGELEAIKAVLEELKAKDIALEGQIVDLKTYVDSELKATEDWVTATFATLEQYNTVVTTIATIEGQIEGINESIAALETRINEKIAKDIEAASATLSADLQKAVEDITTAYTSAIATAKEEITTAYTAALEEAISVLETSMKEWVNEQLSGYYTIAEMDAKLVVLEKTCNNKKVEAEIAALREQLVQAKKEITQNYQSAITEAINTNNGVIDAKISAEIATVNEKITGLENRLNSLEDRVCALEDLVEDLINQKLEIIFDEIGDDAISAGGYCEIGYVITSSEVEVHIATVAQNGWRATVKKTTSKTGYITVYAPNPLTSEPIMVFVSDANTTIMRTLTFVDGITTIATKSYSLAPSATTLSVGVQTNLDYEVVIPSSAQSWISLQSITTRASMRNDSINLAITENTTTQSRSATLQLVCENVEVGTISICQQRAEIASTELIYTTTNGEPIILYNADGFTSKVISNRYTNGRGVIVFNDDLTSIGEYAFYNCTTLESITMPKTITTIGESSFSGCLNLANISIPDNVVSIDANAFYDCDSLDAMDIPDSVSSIGDSAFANCDKLKSVSIGGGVMLLGIDAFNCPRLTELFIKQATPPSGGNSILSSNNFNCKIYVPIEGCRSYKVSEEWRACISNIVAYDFKTNVAVKIQFNNEIWYTSTNGVVVKPYSVVFGANLLSNTYKDGTGVMIFDGDVTCIGGWAFSDCSTLSTISIPQSVTKIEHHAFNECSRLKSANIPDGVTSIGNHAFNECSSFTTVVIPDTVKSISVLAFWGCPSICVYCKAATPPKGDFDMFSSVSGIYVPAESVNAYKAASYWNTYKSYIYGYDFE